MICIDLETTDLNIATARIVEIAIIDAEGIPLFVKRLNPGVEISPGAVAAHGITNADVELCPMFKDVAGEVFSIVSDHDSILGFNSTHFDVPLLWEELHRAGYDWCLTDVHLLDAYALYAAHERRDLTAAVKRYLGREHRGAHSAHADALATLHVWRAQLSEYELDHSEPHELAATCRGNRPQNVDLAGYIILNENGQPVYNRGKAKGQLVSSNKGYGTWMLRNDFPANTKLVLQALLS